MWEPGWPSCPFRKATDGAIPREMTNPRSKPYRLRFAGAAFRASRSLARLRLRISCGEYIVPRHFFAPQLQIASSSPPS